MSEKPVTEKTLVNRWIVVTGAAKGIGAAIVSLCAQQGANVVINYKKSRSEAEELARTISEKQSVIAIPCYFDVTCTSEIEAAITPIIEQYGAISGWVNNAGINLPGLLLSQTDDMILQQLQVNIEGPMKCSRFILKHMMAQRVGSIVNIGSIASHYVSRGQTVYAATKGALSTFTRAVAQEYGRKSIRINCIEPGPVETEMFATSKSLAGDELKQRVPLARFGATHEIAELAVFLLSDKSSYMTGSIIAVDGGYSLG
ncbi:3-oxoacyl-[acyl-carrier protein] reductase [hydrothermal vent metagenome]|uniref:3-oxoacyl-[acyl-carrier protein] reductase n=1 Tax=hydrothermal vent metagenome TaxID=652676 RepID=A0A3B0YRA1_9ZZZZ